MKQQAPFSKTKKRLLILATLLFLLVSCQPDSGSNSGSSSTPPGPPPPPPADSSEFTTFAEGYQMAENLIQEGNWENNNGATLLAKTKFQESLVILERLYEFSLTPVEADFLLQTTQIGLYEILTLEADDKEWEEAQKWYPLWKHFKTLYSEIHPNGEPELEEDDLFPNSPRPLLKLIPL